MNGEKLRLSERREAFHQGSVGLSDLSVSVKLTSELYLLTTASHYF